MNFDMTLRECLTKVKLLYETNLLFKCTAVVILLSLVFLAGHSVGNTIGSTFSVLRG